MWKKYIYMRTYIYIFVYIYMYIYIYVDDRWRNSTLYAVATCNFYHRVLVPLWNMYHAGMGKRKAEKPSVQAAALYILGIQTHHYIIVIHCVDFLQTHHPSWRIDWLSVAAFRFSLYSQCLSKKTRGLTMDPLDSIRRVILRLPIRSFKTSVQPGWPATSLRHQHQGARDFSGLTVMSSNYWLGWCETMTKYVEISGHLAQHGLPLTPVVPFSLQFWKKQVWWPRVKFIQSHTVGLTAFQHMPQLWLSFFDICRRQQGKALDICYHHIGSQLGAVWPKFWSLCNCLQPPLGFTLFWNYSCAGFAAPE